MQRARSYPLRKCPSCGGRKDINATVCRTCWAAGRGGIYSGSDILMDFDTEKFVEWTTRMGFDAWYIAYRTKLHENTIRGWMRGVKPTRVAFKVFADEFELVPCTHCGGSGYKKGKHFKTRELRPLTERFLNKPHARYVRSWRKTKKE